MITPKLVRAIVSTSPTFRPVPPLGRRLVGIGSIMHFARNGDVVWGAGVNGKADEALFTATELDIRAVRGPLTRDFLERRGIPAPAVFGDPALLLPAYLPQLREWTADRTHALTIVPNLNDLPGYPERPELLNPRSPLMLCLERIARSRFVVGSSLHGIIIAEALGVPARLVTSPKEHRLKYEDYFLGTGRGATNAASSLDQALREGSAADPLDFSTEPLARAFPRDLWLAH
jgi:pyruvyltransferase